MSADDLLRLLVAVLVGGVLGVEREFRDKAAGFRTLVFISVGAALFTIFSAKLAGDAQDMTRIASNIVSGVGFLGAGVILRESGRVHGLTTAAIIWLAAALGMGAGGGQYQLTLGATVVALVVLWAFPALERVINRLREERSYEVVCAADGERLAQVEQLFRDSGLDVVPQPGRKAGGLLTCRWRARGPLARHDALVRRLLADPQIEEFRF